MNADHQDPPPRSDRPVIEVLIPSRDRHGPLGRCVESVLAQNYDDFRILIGDDASSPAIKVSDFRQPNRIRITRSEAGLGPIATRTRLVETSSSPILLFLDDDATLTAPDTLSTIVSIFSGPDSPALVAPLVVDHIGGREEVLGPLRSADRLAQGARDVGVFVGAAFAVRREVLIPSIRSVVTSGYGHEEVEYSFLIAGRDERMVFDPRIRVHHFRATEPLNRREAMKRFESAVRNRFLLSRKYLPQPYRSTHIVFWFVRYFVMAIRRRMPRTFLRGLSTGLTRDTGGRRFLSDEAISYLMKVGGRIWY